MSDSVPRWSPEDLPPRPPREPDYIHHIQYDPTWVFDRRAYCPELLAPYVRRPELGFADLLGHALPAALGAGWTVDPAGDLHQRTWLCADPWQGFVVSLVPTAVRPTRRNLAPFVVTRPRAGEACALAVKLLRWFHRKEALALARPLLRPSNRSFHNPFLSLRRVRHPEGALDGVQAHIVGPSAYDWLPDNDPRAWRVGADPGLTDVQHLVMRTIWVAKSLYEVNYPGMPPLGFRPTED